MINKHLKVIGGRGFTLIETLIAIMVLMTAIVGPLTLAGQGLHTTLIAKDQDTAFYLAQDAMEFVRWVRDTNKLHSSSWLAGLDGNPSSFLSSVGNCINANGCAVDSYATSVSTCGGGCTPLYYDSTTNRFNTSSVGSPTIFTRTVQISTPVGSNNSEAAVTIVVTWSDSAGITRNVTIREDIFDWQ